MVWAATLFLLLIAGGLLAIAYFVRRDDPVIRTGRVLLFSGTVVYTVGQVLDMLVFPAMDDWLPWLIVAGVAFGAIVIGLLLMLAGRLTAPRRSPSER